MSPSGPLWHTLAGHTEDMGLLDPRDVEYTGESKYKAATDLLSLSKTHRNGLIAVSTLALVSLVSTLSMIILVTYRLIFWERYTKHYLNYSRYVILIYNLLLADFQQSLAFMLNLYWIAKDGIQIRSPACFMQGLWIQVGDSSSGLFALAICVYSFIQVELGWKIGYRSFINCIIGIWAFIALMAIIPIALHKGNPFTLAGPWCWLDARYETERLWTHYFWIFFAEFGIVVLYTIMFFKLRRRIASAAAVRQQDERSLKRIRRFVYYMIVYPLAYLLLSLPLAAGRMMTAGGRTPSIPYMCVAGALITSSGFVNVLLYTTTRRAIVLDTDRSNDRSQLNPFHHYDYRSNHVATVVADGNVNSDIDSRHIYGRGKTRSHAHTSSAESTDKIIDNEDNITRRDNAPVTVELPELDRVYQKTTTFQITTEPALPSPTYPPLSGDQTQLMASTNNNGNLQNGNRRSIQKSKPRWRWF